MHMPTWDVFHFKIYIIYTGSNSRKTHVNTGINIPSKVRWNRIVESKNWSVFVL